MLPRARQRQRLVVFKELQPRDRFLAACMRQHTSETLYSIRQHTLRIQHSIRQHTIRIPFSFFIRSQAIRYAYSIAYGTHTLRIPFSSFIRSQAIWKRRMSPSTSCTHLHTPYATIHHHTSAYVCIRRHTSAHVNMRQINQGQGAPSCSASRSVHPAYVSVCQHSSASINPPSSLY